MLFGFFGPAIAGKITGKIWRLRQWQVVGWGNKKGRGLACLGIKVGRAANKQGREREIGQQSNCKQRLKPPVTKINEWRKTWEEYGDLRCLWAVCRFYGG